MKKSCDTVGGQAVIEGVMMKSGDFISVATVKDKKISVKKMDYSPIDKKFKIFKLPFLRGFSSLIEMLVLGMKALSYSANEFAGEDEKLSKKEIALTMIISFVIAIGLFIVAPLIITRAVTSDKGFVFNIIDGLLRILVFLIYLSLISLMKEAKRLFEYHGAEHKTVNCYEDGKPLSVRNIKKYSTIHPRCGTAFILIVLVISILVFSFITSDSFIVKFVSRIVLLPVIAGFSYEILRLGKFFGKNPIYRFFIYPGLALQNITTREPDEVQIRAAVAALKDVVRKNNAK